MDVDHIVAVMRQVLSAWPLYTEQDYVTARLIGEGDQRYLGYCGECELEPCSMNMRMAKDPPHFLEANLIDGVFYLLFIQIAKPYRGQGYGEQLYKLCEQLARELGCHQIRQMPSGGYQDTSRLDYLIRRGWQPDGWEVVKDLNSEVT